MFFLLLFIHSRGFGIRNFFFLKMIQNLVIFPPKKGPNHFKKLLLKKNLKVDSGLTDICHLGTIWPKKNNL